MIDRNDIEKLIAENLIKNKDSGWVEVPAEWLRTDTAHGTSSVLKYRKIGNTVHLYGALKTTVNRAAGVAYNIIDMPEGYRPSFVKRFVPQVNGNYDACICIIDTDGPIQWYNKVQLNGGGEMLLHLSYLVY